MSEPHPIPVILIGMHRSGTSMVTRLLEDLGLFAGRCKERNCEARFFRFCNDWLLNQCSARWDCPEPIEFLLNAEDARPLAIEYLRGLLNRPPIATYLGLPRYLRYRTPSRLPVPWGWKDPRNTFTLPIWLDVFGDARIIHVRRHGVDVANSLRVRSEALLARERSRMARYRRWHWWKRGGFVDTMRITTAADGLALWAQYTRQGARHVAALGERALALTYEDFLAAPADHLGRLARFVGLDPSPEAIAPAVADVRPDRAFAYRQDPALAALADEHAECLAEFGY